MIVGRVEPTLVADLVADLATMGYPCYAEGVTSQGRVKIHHNAPKCDRHIRDLLTGSIRMWVFLRQKEDAAAE